MLLATDKDRETVWHMAACWSGRYLLQEAWEWAKENMTTDEIKIICY